MLRDEYRNAYLNLLMEDTLPAQPAPPAQGGGTPQNGNGSNQGGNQGGAKPDAAAKADAAPKNTKPLAECIDFNKINLAADADVFALTLKTNNEQQRHTLLEKLGISPIKNSEFDALKPGFTKKFAVPFSKLKAKIGEEEASSAIGFLSIPSNDIELKPDVQNDENVKKQMQTLMSAIAPKGTITFYLFHNNAEGNIQGVIGQPANELKEKYEANKDAIDQLREKGADEKAADEASATKLTLEKISTDSKVYFKEGVNNDMLNKLYQKLNYQPTNVINDLNNEFKKTLGIQKEDRNILETILKNSIQTYISDHIDAIKPRNPEIKHVVYFATIPEIHKTLKIPRSFWNIFGSTLLDTKYETASTEVLKLLEHINNGNVPIRLILKNDGSIENLIFGEQTVTQEQLNAAIDGFKNSQEEADKTFVSLIVTSDKKSAPTDPKQLEKEIVDYCKSFILFRSQYKNVYAKVSGTAEPLLAQYQNKTLEFSAKTYNICVELEEQISKNSEAVAFKELYNKIKKGEITEEELSKAAKENPNAMKELTPEQRAQIARAGKELGFTSDEESQGFGAMLMNMLKKMLSMFGSGDDNKKKTAATMSVIMTVAPQLHKLFSTVEPGEYPIYTNDLDAAFGK